MASDRQGLPIQQGAEVYGADGDKVGTVAAVTDDFIVVEQGWFFPTDYYIPISAIASADDAKVYLTVEKDVALDQGWDKAPVTGIGQASASIAPDAGTLNETALPPVEAPDRPTGRFASDVATTTAESTLRIPVYEEELTATRTVREVAGARIEKIVAVERQPLDPATTEERLKVVRRTVNQPGDAANADVYEEVLIDVPLNLDLADLGNRTRVTEEIAIWKEAVQRTERVMGTVRREKVTVTEVTDGALVEDQESIP